MQSAVQTKIRKRDMAIASDYKKGKSVVELAEENGISRQTIYRILKHEIGEIEKYKWKSARHRTKKRNAAIKNCYRRGKCLETLEKEYKLAKETICEILRKQGVNVRKTNARLKKKEELSIVKSYTKGKDILDILLEHDITNTSFYRLLKQNGVKVRRNSSKISKRNQEIVEKYKDGKTVTELVTEHSISSTAIYGILKQSS